MAKTLARKLLLVRKLNVTADLVEKNGLAPFSKGKPIPVSPQAWNEEAGLSHWAYVLEGMKLKDLEMLGQWHHKRPNDTVLDLAEDVETALAGVGLRINSLQE